MNTRRTWGLAAICMVIALIVSLALSCTTPAAPSPAKPATPAPAPVAPPAPAKVSPTAEKPLEWKYASALPAPGARQRLIFEPWVKTIQEKSGGRIKITIYPSETLLKGQQIYDGVVNNICQLGFADIEGAFGKFPQAEVAMMPMAPWAKNEATANHLIYNMLAQGYFANDFKAVKPIGLIAAPPQVVHSAKKPLATLNDFKGFKIATGQPGMTKLMELIGASPSNIPAPEHYQAVQKGTTDGTSFSWVGTAIYKIQEVSTVHNESPWAIGFIGTVMNKETYDSLPADLQKVIDDVSGEWYSKFTTDVDTGVAAGVRKLCQDRGDWVGSLSAADEATARDLAKQYWADWVKNEQSKGVDGQKLLDAALKISSEFKGWSLK